LECGGDKSPHSKFKNLLPSFFKDGNVIPHFGGTIMCFKIDQKLMQTPQAGALSFTGKLICEVNNFRNGFDPDYQEARPSDMSVIQTVGRVAIAEGLYGVLLLAYVVETAVRSLFAVFITVGICASKKCSGEAYCDLMKAFVVVHIVDTPMRAITALFSVCTEEVTYEGLALCQCECCVLPRNFLQTTIPPALLKD
jgi:hypothetical protein